MSCTNFLDWEDIIATIGNGLLHEFYISLGSLFTEVKMNTVCFEMV